MLGTMSNDSGGKDPSIMTGVMADATAKPYIKVLGLQWGMLSQLSTARSYNLPLWQTEHKCGNYPWNPAGAPAYKTTAPNDQAYAVESWGLIRDWIKGGVTAYSAWNMVLDTVGKGIDTTRDWAQNALLTVNTSSKTLNLTPTYHVFRHFSQFVEPGAKVVATSGGDAIAFKNPNGSIVTVMYNSGGAKTTIVSASRQEVSVLDARQRMGYRRFAMTIGMTSPSTCHKTRPARRIVDHDRGPLCDRVQHLGEAMSNKNLKTPLFLLMTVGFAAAAGCRLSPPKSVDQGEGGVCSEDPDVRGRRRRGRGRPRRRRRPHRQRRHGRVV